MSNVTELRPKAAPAKAPHIPTASPKPTTTKAAKPKSSKVPNAVQSRMSDAQVGERKPPEPTSETLALAGGAQTIAMGKGNLRNLERGMILEVVVHATVVEAGGVRDKLGKGGAVSDSIAKVVATIDRFDEVKVVGMADVDAVEDDHPGDAPAEDSGERETCHRCEGKGTHTLGPDEVEECGLCKGVGSIPKADGDVIDAEGDEIVEPAGELTAGDGDVMFGGAPPVEPKSPLPDPPKPAPLTIGDASTYTEENLRAKGITKPTLAKVWADLTGRELPGSITKPKLLDAILKVQSAGKGAAPAEGEERSVQDAGEEVQGVELQRAAAMQVTSERYAGAIEDGAAADEPTQEEAPALDTGGADAEDGHTTGKVAALADDGSDVFAQVDGDGIRIFVHARSGQAYDTLGEAVKHGATIGEARPEGEGSDPAPAAEVEGQARPQVDGETLTVDEASALTQVDLAQRSDAQLVDVAVALGVDRKQAATLNRIALLGVIEREQIPF